MFALATIVHRCLTGRAPGPGLAASTIVATLDPRLDGLLADAMALDPSARPDAATLRKQLQTILDTPRPVAKPSSEIGRAHV